MVRRNEPREPRLPEAPWTYSPSEVQDWIQGAYPSGKRRRKEVRKGPETVTRLRFTVLDAEADDVRSAVREALRSVGVAMAEGEPSGERARGHVAVTTVRPSLFGSKVRVSATFTPPIHPSSSKALTDRLSHSLRVRDIDETQERARLSSPKAGDRGGPRRPR